MKKMIDWMNVWINEFYVEMKMIWDKNKCDISRFIINLFYKLGLFCDNN